MTSLNDVGRPLTSFYSDLDVDYILDEQSWWHGSIGVDQLLVLWKILGYKNLVKVPVFHMLPHMVSSWWLHDNYYYTTIQLKETTISIDFFLSKVTHPI